MTTHNSKKTHQNTESSLESIAHDAGEKLGELASQFSGDASEFLDTSRAYIKKNPGKSLAIAAAAGAVVGSLVLLALGRRR